VREYATPSDFRAAVESRLRERARRLGVPAYLIRRQAAVERLIVRLTRVAPGKWAIKGGIGLETRLGEHARVSLDLDADHIQGADRARADLQRAAVEDLGDHFAFALVASEPLVSGPDRLAIRYSLDASLSGRPFEPVQVDVTIAPPSSWDPQPAERPGLLSEFGLGPVTFALVPLERQVAEKLHAYTRTYKGGGTTRAKDLVDLVLIREYGKVDAVTLRRAIRSVFASRATHPVPEYLAPPPRALAPAFRREATSVGIVPELSEAHHLLVEWLDPVLREIRRL
jgi:hypothetical protein